MTYPSKLIGTPELAACAMATVRKWQADTRVEQFCPICSAPGVKIVDKSSRPHMSWYEFTCQACGLHEAVAVPTGAHTTDHDS
ncbi:MAG: hypothetical protein KJ587_17840 [Alphaproteobacteria bacterium]|nr:hypothetical protein [Alphaproteobacteria bacterium]